MALTKVSSGLISADASLVDLNIDAGTLYIDATNNRVGVSNQAPTVALEVTGDLVVSASATLGDTQVGQLTFSSLTNTTTDIPEGSKLFFTEQRVLDTTPGGSLSGTLGDVTVQYRTDGNYSGTAQQGSFYFDALNQRLKVYTGSEFIDTIPFTAGGGGGATTEANATFFKYQYTVTSETNNISGADIQEIESGAYVIGKDYEISVPGTTDFTALGAADNNIGTTFTATASGLVSAGDFVATEEYTIVSVDDGAGGATTDFTLIGAADNNIGTTFTATGVGTGTGTASQGSGTAHGILGYSTSSSTDVVVFVNGVKQRESLVDGYQATTGTTIAFTYNLPVDSIVDVQVYELLKNDAYYTKAQTYTQAEVNTQISTALSTYDDQTASDARYVNITGDTMTGNLDVTGNVTADGLTVDNTSAANIYLDGTGTGRARVHSTFGILNLTADADSDTAGTSIKFKSGSTERMKIDSDTGDITFYDTSGNAKFFWDASAESLSLSGEGTLPASIGSGAGVTRTGYNSSGDVIGRTFIGDGTGYSFHFSKRISSTTTDLVTITDTGNVGIGTTIPVVSSGYNSLTIDGTNSGYLVLQNNGTTKMEAYVSGGTEATLRGTGVPLAFVTTAAHDMTFDTNATERMRIDASGNVTIGTPVNNDADAQLHVYGLGQTTADLTDSGDMGATLRLSDVNTAAGSGGAIVFANQQGDVANSAGFAAIKGLLSNGNTNTIGHIAFSTRDAIGDTALTERMRIDSAGRVGIGTDIPSDLMTIQSPASGGGNGITIKRNDNGTDQRVGAISFGNTVDSDLAQITAQTSAGNNGDGNLLFHTQPNGGSSTEAMRINASGTLITKGAAIFNEDGADADFRVESVNRSNAFVVDASADAITTDAIFIHDSDGGNQRFYITRTGASDQSGSMYTDDAQFVFDSVQDETTLSFGGFLFRSTNATNSNVQLLSLAQTESRFNDDGADIDFRVESVNDSSMLFVDASEDSVNIGAHKFASTPTSTDNDFVHFNTGAIVVNDSSSATVNLFQRSASGSGVSCAGTVFVACEGSGQNVSWGYIIDFFYSNNVFTSTARETGSSQGTTTCSVQENGTAISVSVAYTTGLGGNIKFNAGGHAVVCNY